VGNAVGLIRGFVKHDTTINAMHVNYKEWPSYIDFKNNQHISTLSPAPGLLPRRVVVGYEKLAGVAGQPKLLPHKVFRVLVRPKSPSDNRRFSSVKLKAEKKLSNEKFGTSI